MDPHRESDPALDGQWEPIEHHCRHLPVHMALLHTGKVLAFGGSGNDQYRLCHPHPAELWDVESGVMATVDQELDGDLFCAGHSFLGDGRLVVAGGTHRYDWGVPNRLRTSPLRYLAKPFAGLEQTYLFDPKDENWTRAEDMRAGRWYPTLVTLGDGRVLAVAGFTKGFPWYAQRKIEIFSHDEGWSCLEGADRWLPLYPRLHLLPGGCIFYSGSYNTHYVFPFFIKAFPTALLDLETRRWTTIGPPQGVKRQEGASVLLPLRPPSYRPRVLLVGGGAGKEAEATNTAEIIDLSAPCPQWRATASMRHARFYTYAVLLPDGNVLVLGGQHGKHGHESHDVPGHDPKSTKTVSVEELGRCDPTAVREPELFDPKTEQWRELARMSCDRLYHSAALLLPNGCVLVAGSNPDRRINELRIEVFRPPYLFRGKRPTIAGCGEDVGYGGEIRITTPDAGQIDEVCLMRPSSTTHCLDTDQRYVGLEFRADESVLYARVPRDHAVAPPGYYMLFILREGIPSVATFVRLTPPGTTGHEHRRR